MRIGDIDTSATRGDSVLHRTSPVAKLLAFAFVLGAAVVTWNALLVLGLALALSGLVLGSRLPARQVFALATYPAVFAAIFAFASAPDPLTATTMVLKAVTAALAAVTVVFTTPYPQIFAPLQRIVPSLVGDSLLMTYRALFLLLDKFAGLLRAVRLRSGLSRGRPVRAMRATTAALGGLLLYSFDLSQRQYDVMRLRGYEGRLNVTLPQPERPARDAALVCVAALALATSVSWRVWWETLNGYSWLPATAGIVLLAAGMAWRGRPE